MNSESLRAYCLAKPCVTEGFPFDSDTLVFKVAGKAFLLTGLDHFRSINVKCDPERAIEMRERYSAIRPGYHMNKKHWNTIDFDGSLSDRFIFDEIDHSYECVVAALPKSLRKSLGL